MRWNSDRPYRGQRRQVRRFLLLPQRARYGNIMQTRWLEMTEAEESYSDGEWHIERWI